MNSKVAKIPEWVEGLIDLEACSDAVKWASLQASLETAWTACDRPDWMLWLIGRTVKTKTRGTIEHRSIVLTVCVCARRSLRFVPEGELQPLRAIEIAERWANGDDSVTVGEIRDAADAADAAYAASAAAYAAAAAAAAADAADAAYAAAADAAYAAAAAAVAASAAYAASAAAYVTVAAAGLDERRALCAIIRDRHACPTLRENR